MDEICCIGHITKDKIITGKMTNYMAGGTSIYFSSAISKMPVKYTLVTALAESEMQSVADLRSKGINVIALPSQHTVYFQNSYAENQDYRTQKVLEKADPFSIADVRDLNARIFHLGPLLADDMSAELIRFLADKGTLSLDVQGFLRKVEGTDVIPIDWADKMELLPYISILKASEHEMEVLTGESDKHTGAKILAGWGVKEVIITMGYNGSLIYADGNYYDVPAYEPAQITDATGCGDTYMAGYLYQRVKGADYETAGRFAAAMASLKIEESGPFVGDEGDVRKVLERR